MLQHCTLVTSDILASQQQKLKVKEDTPTSRVKPDDRRHLARMQQILQKQSIVRTKLCLPTWHSNKAVECQRGRILS